MKRLALLACALSLIATSACADDSQARTQPDDTIVHENIVTTWFQAGAPAGPDDLGISNESSAWYSDWSQHMCTVDSDGSRELGQKGCDNLYYFALPCADYDEAGPIPEHIEMSPWKSEVGGSAFKNRWIQVNLQLGSLIRTVFVQWQDVGPLYTDDCEYVFGEERPRQERTGDVESALDISPAAFKYLVGDLSIGRFKTEWHFVDEAEVPPGPWTKNITTARPDWD